MLLYRRWRSEVQADVEHHDAAHAAVTAVETTGRAVLIGGTALVVALLLARLIADTQILTSLGIGALLCSALSVGAAVVVMPGLPRAGRAPHGGVRVRCCAPGSGSPAEAGGSCATQ